MGNAFEFLIAKESLEFTSNYPYIGTQEKCSYTTSLGVGKVISWETASSTNEDTLATMLYNTGPLSTAMNADYLQFYESGIISYTSSQCNPETLNHGVTLVGYGVSGITEYWIVKNSWGANWGEEGYFRIAKGSGVCGINTYVVTATLA